MSRSQTENEIIGKFLEHPVTRSLKLLKEAGMIKDYQSNVQLKYGGDLDHIIKLNDGSFLHLEDMNLNTNYSYSERSSRIKELPKRLKVARQLFEKVHKTVLIITNCLTASHGWLDKNHIKPIIIGEQITELIDEKRFVGFGIYLVRELKRIIEKIQKKGILKSRMTTFLRSFAGFGISFARIVESFGKTLKSDAIKWLSVDPSL